MSQRNLLQISLPFIPSHPKKKTSQHNLHHFSTRLSEGERCERAEAPPPSPPPPFKRRKHKEKGNKTGVKGIEGNVKLKCEIINSLTFSYPSLMCIQSYGLNA
jgi:hypothetical protein